MAKNNFYVFLLMFFGIFVFPVRIVYLDELEISDITKTYNNYYFFIEPFDENYANRETVNYGLFAPPRIGHFEDNLELVELRRTSSNTDEDFIDTFHKFFIKNNTKKSADFIFFRTVTNDGKEENQYCLVSSYEKVRGSEIDIYYMHSCYKNDDSWAGYFVKNENGEYCNKNDICITPGTQIISTTNDLEYACASVNRFFKGSGASIVNVTAADDGVYSGDKYYVYKITRANIGITDDKPTNYLNVKIGNKFDANNNNSSCPNNDEYYVNPTEDDKMYSPVLGKYSYKVHYYGCKKKPINTVSNCNLSKTINQNCSDTTIESGNNNTGNSIRADFSLSQTGTISNIISPNSIYQGGGINIGFIYYNTFSWNYRSGTLRYYESNTTESEAKDELLSVLKGRIKRTNEFENDLSVNINITPVIDLISDINNNIVKKCNQTITGGFEEGNVTTVCTVFMPVTNIMPYSGKISGVSSKEGDGINNKMYTELHYSGELNFSAVASGLNVLRNGLEWSIEYNPNNDDNSCQVNVYSRLYDEDSGGSKAKSYKFIYRPIDLNNPFPSGRIAGVNWYDWYKEDINRERLKNSYSRLQYRVNLNPSRVAEIKKYNNGKNYLDWDGFEEENSSFINKDFRDYFDIKGQNIVGDIS